MRRSFLIVLAAAFALSFVGLAVSQRMLGRATAVIGGARVAVDVARSMPTITAGLSGRDRLSADSGMLFIFPFPARHAMWMKGMQFAIDIVWMRDGKIVDIAPNLQPAPPDDRNPPSYEPRLDADAVLELPAGFSAAHGLKIGDAVAVGD